MANIDIGAAATDRSGSTSIATYTVGSLTNPSNDSGTLDTVEMYFNVAATNVDVGTIYLISGTTYKTRDVGYIGSVAAGSKQTASGLSISVETGDLIAIKGDTGEIDTGPATPQEVLRYSGDSLIIDTQVSYVLNYSIVSLYGSGSTPPTTSIKTLNGTAIANIAKWNGIAIGDYKTILEISNVD